MSSFLRSHDVLFPVLFACFVFAIIHVVPIVEGLGTFGLDIHHRYSHKVNKFLGNDGLSEKDTVDYFTALVHRDHLRGRRLSGDSTPLTFVGGNLTLYIAELAFLQYAAVSLGTPGTEFIVALDTGSNLLWIPCECTHCPRKFTIGTEQINLNIYSVRNSSTVEAITCGNPICSNYHCLKEDNLCSYGTSDLTSTSGLLLEDVLKLVTNENEPSPVNTNVTFGCGVVQTGSFLRGGPINGVLGLGRHAISVPSTLARSGLTADSFSMCFGSDAFGRIVFGDKGSLDQSETPFINSTSDPTYTVSVEEVFVGGGATNLKFSALFDSGSSFTSFPSAIYKTLTESFRSQVLDPPLSDSKFIFEYCYSLSVNSSGTGYESPKAPNLTFTMRGGHHFNVTAPLIIILTKENTYVSCLAILNSTSTISVIGQNFMTGYRFVYDRENLVLGWKESDCYDSKESNMAPAPAPSSNTTNSNLRGSSSRPSSVAGNAAGTTLNSFSWTFVMAFFSLFSHYLIFHFF